MREGLELRVLDSFLDWTLGVLLVGEHGVDTCQPLATSSPHREEYSQPHGHAVQGEKYCPDLDQSLQ